MNGNKCESDLFESHVFEFVLANGDVPHTHYSAGPGRDDCAVVGTGSTHSLSPVRQALTHSKALQHRQ